MVYQILIEDIFHNRMSTQARQGTTLFSALSALSSIAFGGNCGGKGRCKACVVYSVTHQCEIKSCETIVESDLHIRLPFGFLEECKPSQVYKGEIDPLDRLGFAMDLGTTTIGIELWNLNTKILLAVSHIYNPQISYGADAISRISYCTTIEARWTLCNLVWSKVTTHMLNMLAMYHASADMVADIVLSGNPIMIQLALNQEVRGFGVYPFTDVDIPAFCDTLGKIWPKEQRNSDTFCAFAHVRVKGLPGICSLVGADILAGAYCYGLGLSKEYDLLIDLGTNGEMLLINQDRGYSVSTACGPAFDGYITNQAYGTNVLSRIGLLRQRNIIDSNGKLMDRYIENGYEFPDGIVIRQEDVRELQKAKAAILTGIEILLDTVGISAADCNVYVAGNFGFHLDLAVAKAIGMLPDGFLDVRVVGNSCLDGSRKLLFQYEEGLTYAHEICQRTRYIDLSNTPDYQSKYLSALELDRK